MQKLVFTGIQPTGYVHLGNWLGMIRNCVELQDRFPCYYCIVDYHAITIPYDAEQMPKLIREAILINVAAGVDPDRSTVFVQSQVPEHTELAWLLNTITPIGQLQRMTQFKDKSRRQVEAVNAGLLNYPVLQAADVLLYKANLVPVGEDQLQHMELMRNIANRFNNHFGDYFPEPEAYVSRGARIMSLDNPERKMSKSEPSGAIGLLDSPDEIRAKFRKAVTDVGPVQGRMSPGTTNLFSLLELLAPADIHQRFLTQYESGTLRYVELKDALAEYTIEALKPIQARYHELTARPDAADQIVAKGAASARRVAQTILSEVKERMGLHTFHHG